MLNRKKTDICYILSFTYTNKFFSVILALQVVHLRVLHHRGLRIHHGESRRLTTMTGDSQQNQHWQAASHGFIIRSCICTMLWAFDSLSHYIRFQGSMSLSGPCEASETLQHQIFNQLGSTESSLSCSLWVWTPQFEVSGSWELTAIFRSLLSGLGFWLTLDTLQTLKAASCVYQLERILFSHQQLCELSRVWPIFTSLASYWQSAEKFAAFSFLSFGSFWESIMAARKFCAAASVLAIAHALRWSAVSS